MGQQYFCDGSGGYVWASDSSLLITGFSYVSGYVRSQAQGTIIYAYSSLASGYPSALQNSMLMVLQCTLPSEPIALDNAVAWYANIAQPFEANAGSMVPVSGSAWIDKTATSPWMDFRSYRMFYQQPESTEWIEIPVDSLNEKRNEVLANWNTLGLPAGQYILKLVIHDDWGNSAEALKGIMLQPSFGIEEMEGDSFRVYPNPAEELLYIELAAVPGKAIVRIADMAGKTLMEKDFDHADPHFKVQIPVGSLKPGCYLITLINENKKYFNKIILK